MVPFEFVVIGEPVSINSKSTPKKRKWQALVRKSADAVWTAGDSPLAVELKVSILYAYETTKRDADNIPKFVVDALKGLVYADDGQIGRVFIDRIQINDHHRIRNVTPELARGIASGRDFVFVRV